MQPLSTARRFSGWTACTAAAILIAASLLLFAQPAFAQSTITVTTTADNLDNNGDCSLREAIESANRDMSVDSCTAGNGADTVLLPAGVYTITLDGASEDNNQTGDYDVTSSVQIVGADAGSSIAAAKADRILHIHANATVTLTGVRLSGGLTPLTEAGGAILNAGDLTIEHSVIEDSRTGGGQYPCTPGAPCNTNAGSGGGIANLKTLTMTATTVQSNTTGINTDSGVFICPNAPGGGIYNRGDLRIAESEITANQAGEGGGVYNVGQAVIVSTTVSSNSTTVPLLCDYPYVKAPSSGAGAGIVNANGTIELFSSIVFRNSTPTGGIGNRAPGGNGGSGAGILNSGRLLAYNSTIAQNSTGDGGGSVGVFEGDRMGGNGGDGGGLYNTGTAVLNNVTLAFNTAGQHGVGVDGDGRDGDGGGIINRGELRLRNTIVGSNGAAIGISDCAGDPLISLGFNLISAAECAGVNSEGDRVGIAPQVSAVAYFGGPTYTSALLKWSPAIDAGSCLDSDQRAVTVDQRGVVRPQGSSCDVGAYEFTAADPLVYLYLPACRR